MSKFHEYQSEFRDEESLVKGLNDMGYKDVEVHKEPVSLFDYRGRKTTYLDKAGDKANVIVRRKFVGPAANDLGFVKKADGSFSAIVSEFDSGKHDHSWFVNLKKAYGENAAIKVAQKNGFKYLGKKVNATGKVQMQWLDTRS
jgi:hypothetical protein